MEAVLWNACSMNGPGTAPLDPTACVLVTRKIYHLEVRTTVVKKLDQISAAF